MKQYDNRRFFLLLLFICIVSLGYGVLEYSNDNKTDSRANAGAARCGCSKCHTLELTSCKGCHNSPNTKSDPNDSAPGSQPGPESDPFIPESNSAQKTDGPPKTTPGDNNSGAKQSEDTPDKSMSQKGSGQTQR